MKLSKKRWLRIRGALEAAIRAARITVPPDVAQRRTADGRRACWACATSAGTYLLLLGGAYWVLCSVCARARLEALWATK